MFEIHRKKAVTFMIILSLLAMILCGCGMSEKTQDEMQQKIDQYEEALRYNYTTAYTMEADAFKRISGAIAEFDTVSQTEINCLKGKISGMLQSDISDLYRNTYDLCDEKMENPLIPDEIREASENLIGVYREYLTALNDTSEQHFAELLQKEEFRSLNGQLQEMMTKYLVIDLSDDDGDRSGLYLENVDEAGELMYQLQKMTERDENL